MENENKLNISDLLVQLRTEMPQVDQLYVTRIIAVFLSAITEANPEAAREWLFTEIPIAPALATEIGIASRVSETGCVAMCFDLLSYICGFVRYNDDRVAGSLTAIYQPKDGSEEIAALRGFIALADVPLAALAGVSDEMANCILESTDKSTN
jgi:hypothetical protein